MSFLLNGVNVEDLRVNGVQVDRAYLNGVEVYSRIGVGTVLPDGGIIFAQEGGYWLVVAPASQRSKRIWSSPAVDVALPYVSGTAGGATPPNDPNSSKYNTDVLVDRYGASYAAGYCRSIGYDLPNTKDLQLVYNNRSLINAADSTGNLADEYAWSSTRYNSERAWGLLFSHGSWVLNLRSSFAYWAIPVKRIPV